MSRAAYPSQATALMSSKGAELPKALRQELQKILAKAGVKASEAAEPEASGST